MIVVADTSPLNYLIQVDAAWVLHEIYARVLIPREVFDEMAHVGAKAVVRDWVGNLPNWVEVREVASFPRELLLRVDVGEACAIQLAKETRSPLLLLDDLRARREAALAGLNSTGTLGVILEADSRKLVDGHQCFRKLCEQTNFYISSALEVDFLAALGNR